MAQPDPRHAALEHTDRRLHGELAALGASVSRRRFMAGLAGALAVPLVPRAFAQSGGGVVYPYLHGPTPNSIWVSWWSSGETGATVDFSTNPAALTDTASGTVRTGAPFAATDAYHMVKLTGLLPSTYYYYKARTSTSESAVHRFRTPPPLGTKTGRFRVLIHGDNQIISSERRWERIVNLSKAKVEALYGAPLEACIDLILNIGDQVDVGTINHWRNLHFEYGRALTPVLASMTTVGNHETYSGDGDLTRYKALFDYTQYAYQGIASPGNDCYYAHQQANILFVHLNSETMPNRDEGAGDRQRDWVQEVVNAARTDATVDFIVSLVHRPYQAEQYVGDISAWFRSEAMPILCQTEKHVLNLGAHHHLYARGQTRDWPCYHIINGATAWDQYWGQSTEIDFDDVQKTIAFWAWQIADFDLANRRLEVSCFAEANVRLPQATRWTSQAYNSRLVDAFHRQLGLPPPSQPSITNTSGAGPGQPNIVALPYVLTSSAFATSAPGEAMNSTQFQIAVDADFAKLRVDRIRDVSNLYGDTGAPLYEPVDRNAGVDITRFEIPADSLPNSRYFARVRHRDTNAVWSPWSAPFEFTVTGSTGANPQLTLAKRIFAPGEPVVIGYERNPVVAADWVGVFPFDATPANAVPVSRQFATGGAGSRRFSYPFPPGAYFAGLFSNNTTAELAPRAAFYVGNAVTLQASQDAYADGATVRLTWAGAPGGPDDRVLILRVGEEPASATPAASAPARTVTGQRDFPGLPSGYYYAVFLINGGTFELSARVPFSIGTTIASVWMPSATVPLGNPFTVNFSGGPGIPKDWIGVFAAGSTPGIDELIAYLYFAGATSGSVTFDLPALPAGDYFVAMFTNDSYTEVSNRFAFSVVAP